MSTEFSCNYHSSRITVDKCENCSAYICLECKKIFRGNRSRTNPNFLDNRLQRSHSYSSKTILCPLCYYDAEESLRPQTNRMNIIFPVIFISIFIGFFAFILGFLFIFIGDSQSFSIIFWIFVPMFLIVPIVFLGIFLFTVRFSRPKITRHIQKEREAFQQSLTIPLSSVKPTYESTELFCTTCGAIIEFNERDCPKCGSAAHNL
ncbi:MAG: hypothetical protein ACW99R_00010 [Candidatus Hodarchaeales archaeon]